MHAWREGKKIKKSQTHLRVFCYFNAMSFSANYSMNKAREKEENGKLTSSFWWERKTLHHEKTTREFASSPIQWNNMWATNTRNSFGFGISGFYGPAHTTKSKLNREAHQLEISLKKSPFPSISSGPQRFLLLRSIRLLCGRKEVFLTFSTSDFRFLRGSFFFHPHSQREFLEKIYTFSLCLLFHHSLGS